MPTGGIMVTLHRKRSKYILTLFTYKNTKSKPIQLAETTYNNGLEATQALLREGILEDYVSAAYTAMYRRGYKKAYFSKEGKLIYLKL